MTWVRLRESDIKKSSSMLPARMVMDYRASNGAYRTFLETLTSSGEAGFQYGRFFETEAEALEDFQNRATRL